MVSLDSTPRIAMQVSRGVVVASIQVDLTAAVLDRFRDDLLAGIQQSGARGVILDVTGLETLDPEELEGLKRIIAMSQLLGAQTVFAGLRPGVVSALLDVGADVDGLRGALNLDAAFDALSDPAKELFAEREPAVGEE